MRLFFLQNIWGGRNSGSHQSNILVTDSC